MSSSNSSLLLKIGRIHARYLMIAPFIGLFALCYAYPTSIPLAAFGGFIPMLLQCLFLIEFGRPPGRVFPDILWMLVIPAFVLIMQFLEGKDISVFFMELALFENGGLSLAVGLAMLMKGFREKDFGPAIPGIVLIFALTALFMAGFFIPLWEVWGRPTGWRLWRVIIPFLISTAFESQWVGAVSKDFADRRQLGFRSFDDNFMLIIGAVFLWLLVVPGVASAVRAWWPPGM